MLQLTGELCEIGELWDGTEGFRIQLTDGRVVTVIGLSREEVPRSIYVPVTLEMRRQP